MENFEEFAMLRQLFTWDNWVELLTTPVQFSSNDALIVTSTICIFTILICYISSILNNNYSQVDRIWSIIPWIYAWIYVIKSEYSMRGIIFASLVTIWGIRLTYNYWRKGGYKKGEEDYRWAVVKKRYGDVMFQLLNATFIAPFQNIILFLLAGPCYLIIKHETEKELNLIDLFFISVFGLSLSLEIVADEQQWAFQQAKKKIQSQGMRVKTQFLREGLFKYSRHPNFFAEQSVWWIYYLFAAIQTGQYLNWTIFGPILLSLVFYMSTQLTEEITVSKYPEYQQYIEGTSKFFLLPARNDDLKLE